jgi:hypothetical protein
MPRTLTRSYRSFEDARNVVVRLSAAGIPGERIGLVGRQEAGDENAAAGAGIGGAAGAATGFVLGMGALALPGVGPLVAAGWFLSVAAAGALAGGLIGTLVDAGVPRAEAEQHADALERGSAIVTVQAEPEEVARIEPILDTGMPLASAEPAAIAPSPGSQPEDEPRDLSKTVS